MKSLTLLVMLGPDGLSIVPPAGAFEVLHGSGGKVEFLPIEPCDNIELDFDFEELPQAGPAGSGNHGDKLQ